MLRAKTFLRSMAITDSDHVDMLKLSHCLGRDSAWGSFEQSLSSHDINLHL